ncbi:MAG: glycoside hydrolase family 25 protein [Alphaproteobacteria bacterium]|nr:glycoside hydrolase family 25 protein [Alphaproteobacteria bacterium]
MLSRRNALAGLAVAMLGGCGGHKPVSPPVAETLGPEPARPHVPGIDAVIDLSHNVRVDDFGAIRRQANILGVIHKASEGGDWIDPSYAERRQLAERAGLLWGAYHFGTRQFTGQKQAQNFLAAAQPGPRTLMVLDFEPNDPNPRNTMTLEQAEAFVRAIQAATGRLPMVYTRASWVDGKRSSRGLRLPKPVGPESILARCDLWLAEYSETPTVPYAWQTRGWTLWQYAGDEVPENAAYGSVPRTIQGVSHADRNIFNGTEAELRRFWGARA